MQAMQSLFVSTSDKSSNFNVNIMNEYFVEIMSIGVRNILKAENID